MILVKTWTLSNEIAMAAAFAYPWDVTGQRFACSQTRGPGSRRISLNLGAILVLGLLILLLGMPGFLRSACAAEPDPAGSKIAIQGVLDFETCARLSIQQSPYLAKSSVEIDVRRIDETDSRYNMVPALTFRTYYYVNHTNQGGSSSKPYSLNFGMEPYNPFGSYFTLQAQKMATRLAIFAHLKIVSEGLERVGKMFLHLATMKRLTAHQSDLVSLSRENLTYAENRLSIGTGTTMEVRVATQELELAKSEKERLEMSQRRMLNSLKTFLGLKPEQEVTFDLRDTRRQVLGNFDPAAATLAQAKSRSYELKGLELRQEMQGYNIALAKAKIFPTILFTTQTPDPLSVNNGGLYVGLGLEVPVWDGFKRIRNVSRQKAILKQYGAEKDLKEIDFSDRWNIVQEDLQSAKMAVKIAQSREELTQLRARQSEIRYHSGTEPLPSWLDARKGNLEAQKNAILKTQEYDELVLNMRQLSGDLGYSYVDQNSWQK